MQKLAVTDKYARFVKRSTSYSYVSHGHTPKQKAGDDNSCASNGMQKNVTLGSNCAKFDVSCSASCSDEIVSICIFPVKIRYESKRKEVTTYALLDNCSQGTFVRENSSYMN